MQYGFRVAGGNRFVKITANNYEDAKELVEKWKKEFRDLNSTDEIIKKGMRDYLYEKYCEDLEQMLDPFTPEKKEKIRVETLNKSAKICCGYYDRSKN